MFNYFVLFFCCLSLSYAQYPLPANGSCDGICAGAPKMQQTDILGVWYLIKHIPLPFFSEGSSCTYVNVTVSNATHEIFDRIEVINGVKYTSRGMSILDQGVRTNTFHSGVKNLTLDTLPFLPISLSPDAFAFFACLECGFFSKEGAGLYGLIYHRLQFPSCAQVDAKLDDITACGIPKEAWIDVDHSSCAQECPASSFSSSAPASVISSYVSSR